MLQAVLRHVDWAVIKCLVIAGPGFVKDQFKQYLEAEAVRRDIRCAFRTVPGARNPNPEAHGLPA